MIQNQVLKFTMLTGFLALSLLFSCKNGLNDRQKLFLDYAKLEDKYHNTGYYRNLDLHNIYIDDPNYVDSLFNITGFKANLKKTFKLITDGDQIQASFGGAALQYPHSYIYTPQKDGSIHVSLSIFVPDTYYRFSLTKDDLGKVIIKDSVELTLLNMNNDAVTLLVENKGRRQSYDYTYDNIDKKDFSNKKDTEPFNKPGYEGYLFTSEQVEEPNSGKTTVKDSLSTTNFARLDISLADEKGKTLLSEGSINDFRHYLWYRNHDMPYPELASAYSEIRSRYKEEDRDSLHKFNPVHIVSMRATGKVGEVKLFLRSSRGHIETVDLGNQIPQQKQKALEYTQSTFEPIFNITKDNTSEHLKINYTTQAVKLNEPDYLVLYASLPHNYNSKDMRMSFEDIKLIGDKKDTLLVEDLENASDQVNIYRASSADNLRALRFPNTKPQATKITGNIQLTTRTYYDKEYKIKQLPKGVTISPDGLILTISRKAPSATDLVDVYAFAKNTKTKPLATAVSDNPGYFSEYFTLSFLKKPAVIVLRYFKSGADVNQEIPFELVLPKKEE
jgi:hypothetical protein